MITLMALDENPVPTLAPEGGPGAVLCVLSMHSVSCTAFPDLHDLQV